MSLLISDDGVFILEIERIDQADICVALNLDEGALCIAPVIDIAELCTSIGDGLGIRYRADTTRLTADNTSITCDYSL
jgi:hypothetical protein